MVIKMSSAFSGIKKGLEEALEFSKCNASKAVTYEFSAADVKDLQAKAYMLHHPKKGDRTPQEATLALPNELDK